MEARSCIDDGCLYCKPESEFVSPVKNHLIIESAKNDLTGIANVTEYGYSIEIFDSNQEEIETYRSGNNALDSSTEQSLSPDHQVALSFNQLVEYARQTLLQMLDETDGES